MIKFWDSYKWWFIIPAASISIVFCIVLISVKMEISDIGYAAISSYKRSVDENPDDKNLDKLRVQLKAAAADNVITRGEFLLITNEVENSNKNKLLTSLKE